MKCLHVFLLLEWASPPAFLFFMETVVKLRGIQSRGNPAEEEEEEKKPFWLESILAGGECCSRLLNDTFSEKLCAYISLSSPLTVKQKL